MKRVIFLVDMNAFFISCEMTRNSALKGKPAAVAGDPKKRTGIILAANYEARALGIKTTMLLNEARRLCPELLVVPPDHDFYAEKSRGVMAILAEFTPVVEQNSIDEAWLDMTGTEGLFGDPVSAARSIMEAINTRLDLWCSIGISDNKFLAKMASEMKKPQGITELWPGDVPAKLWPLPVGYLYGVGRKSAEKLNRLGIQTVGDLARLPQKFLVDTFGKGGETMYHHARGQDFDPVVPRSHDDVQSIGRSTTLSENVSDLDKAKLVLMQLADEVAATARKNGVCGKTVQITLKYTDFSTVTRQTAIGASCGTQDLYLAGCRLLEANWSVDKPIRLIGISLNNLTGQAELLETQHRQVSFFDQPDLRATEQGIQQPPVLPSLPAPSNQQVKAERQQRIDQAMDDIRNRYGKGSIKRAALIKKNPEDDVT